jgi:hypothetical protein
VLIAGTKHKAFGFRFARQGLLRVYGAAPETRQVRHLGAELSLNPLHLKS